MTDAVAGPGYIHSEPLRRGLEINMVIRRLVVHIQQVVIQIAHAAFRAHPVQADGLKGQISHNRIDVVSQGLVHPDKHFLPRNHVAGDVVGLNNLLCQ